MTGHNPGEDCLSAWIARQRHFFLMYLTGN
jgi:hypothetical protein